MRLADTSFWVALAAAGDAHHVEAVKLWAGQNRPVTVTNHIAGETWTYLRRKAGHEVASAALEVFESKRVHLLRTEAVVEDEAWRWLRRHDERSYSFVDATSFAVMRRMRWREALAFDGDFQAAGFIELRTRAP